jgi:hypothetical protein
MRPDTLPPDFLKFMIGAARCPKGSLDLNEKNVRGASVTAEEALAVIRKLRPTKHALSIVSQLPSDAPVIPW